MVWIFSFPPPQSRFLLIVLSLFVFLAGCDPVDVESEPPNADLSLEFFATDVMTAFDNGGCAAAACHAPTGQGEGFAIDPNASRNAPYDELVPSYISAAFSVNLSDPTASKLLTKPLAGVEGHGGGDIFLSDTDLNYQTILTWITNPTP